MPAKQRGSVVMLPSGAWSARCYDENGCRKRAGQAFATRTEAADWLENRTKTVAALRRGDPSALRRKDMPTFDALCNEFLAQHSAEPNTLRALREWLVSSRKKFGDVPVDRIVAYEIGVWRKTLPPRSAWHYTKALRQILNYAVRAQLLERNPAADVPNPRPKRQDVQPFAIGDIDAIGEELWTEATPHFAVIPTLAVWTGLRPGLQTDD